MKTILSAFKHCNPSNGLVLWCADLGLSDSDLAMEVLVFACLLFIPMAWERVGIQSGQERL